MTNTKVLRAGWGEYGINPEDAAHTYLIATDPKYANPNGIPKYYSRLIQCNPYIRARVEESCIELYNYLLLVSKEVYQRKRYKVGRPSNDPFVGDEVYNRIEEQ